MNFFDKLNEWVNDTEGSLVNFLTAFSPWLAPLAPAYMTYHHMVEFLMFDEWLAWVLALVVEILGFGTVSTGLDFWFYNRRNKGKTKQAPIILVAVSFGFYLALIIVSNVAIDVAKAFGTEWHQQLAIVSVRALLTLQTIPAALIVAVRTGHRDLLREIKKEKMDKDSRKVSESFGNLPRDWRNLRPSLDNAGLRSYAMMTTADIREVANRHGVTERTVENWRTNAREELGVDNEQ